jgi:outer membrane protein assembly factor BamB
LLCLLAFQVDAAPNAPHDQGSTAHQSATFRGGPARSGFYDTAAVHRFQKVLWTCQTEGPVRSSPAVTSSTVFVGSGDRHLYAIDRGNGQARWKFETAGVVHGSPAVSGGVVYVTSMDRHLYALDAASGELKWSFTFADDLPFTRGWDFWPSSPLVVDELVFVGGGDGLLYALDAATGAPRWSFETAERVRSSPAMVGGVVYTGSMDGHVYAVDADSGKEVWRYATPGVDLDLEKVGSDRRSIQSSPAVVDGAVIFTSRDHHVYSVSAADGKESWRFDHGPSWVVTSPAVVGGQVFAGSSNGHFLHALELETGVERWRFNTPARIFSSPAVADGVVYFGCHDGFLYALDSATGAEKWRFRTGDMIQSSPVVADGVVYVGSDDGRLYALTGETKADPDRPRLRTAVFWQELVGWQSFRESYRVRDYFEQEGYAVLDGAALAEFMSERIEDGAPSVVIFALDRVPEEVSIDPSATTLFRRYLDSGGKVVWMGMPPLAMSFDPQTGEPTAWTVERTHQLLDVHHRRRRASEPLPAYPTEAGIRWGLSGFWIGIGWVDPSEVTTVLASNEAGFAVAWVKSYGGEGGTGFVSLWCGSKVPFDLAAVKAVAEYREHRQPR